MSLDLLKEFGYEQQAIEENPWGQAHSYGQHTTNAGDNDVFGDFEQSEPAKPTAGRGSSGLGLIDPSAIDSAPDSMTGLQNHNEATSSETAAEVPKPIDQEDDEWGEFMDQPVGDVFGASDVSHANGSMAKGHVETPTSRLVPPSPTLHNAYPAALDTKPKSPGPPNTASPTRPRIISNAQAPPPSNIPPPSILLLLAATLFQSLPVDIKQLLASTKLPSSETASPEQSNIREIQLRLSYARTIARIIGGRKQRWKRDTHLAQSMKIGPAPAGKSSGMKLTGIDRMESRREDQEAAEVVKIWKQRAGRLRALVASANALHPGMNLAFPEIENNMPVRTAKAGEGALMAPKSCVLCGLKREERVQKIDVNVEDSFDEFWMEHWGHVDCKAFWEAHESSLQQRR